MANVATLLAQHQNDPSRQLYRQFVDDQWVDYTVKETIELVAQWQEVFREQGLKRGDRVAICLKNGLTWVTIDQAALASGLVCVPLYVDDNAGNVAYCVSNSAASVLIVENDRIGKALLKTEVPMPRIIVAKPDAPSTGEPVPRDARLETWQSALEKAMQGKKRAVYKVEEAGVDELATICYTSGTSGRPKGVMLSHGNMLSNVESCHKLGIATREDTFLSFLPLSHMFERTGGYYLPLRVGAKVVYSRGVNQLPDDLVTQAPTIIFAVPRIFEKFYGRIQASVRDSSMKRKAFERLVDVGWRMSTGEGGVMDHFQLPLLRSKVAKPILERLGGRLRLAVVGGAALDANIAKAFIAMGLNILHGYGMTEACPVIAVNRPGSNVPESVGPPLPDVSVRLGDDDELQVKGPNVMLGYWQDEISTEKALMPGGWLRTGDVAQIIDDRVFIRGRIKDILVLSNGEKLSPQDVEMAIMSDDVFEQITLVGEGKPYLSMVAVSANPNEKELIKRANEKLKSFPRYIRIRRIIITRDPWTVDNGLLTPTLKVKRAKVMEKFHDQIEAIYSDGSAADA
ncbi:MAG: AMP-binding protein [Burkholderiales bacterium]|nr:AMP-binding protein [Burkholderiales bacterium]